MITQYRTYSTTGKALHYNTTLTQQTIKMALKLFRRKSKAAVVTEPEKAVAEVKKIVEVRLFVTEGVYPILPRS